MTPRFAPAILFLACLVSLVSLSAHGQPGQLQYFGYAGNADDDRSLDMTKGYTNFSHVATRDSPLDPFVRDRVTALAQRGIKATIDLGRVLYCDYDASLHFHQRCNDWETRWSQWKAFNAGILSSDKVLGFTVLDEPFSRGVDMAQHDQVVQRVKSDFPWAKIFLFDNPCGILDLPCGYAQFYPGSFDAYQGTLPGVDWVSTSDYGRMPSTNPTFLSARAKLKNRFPGKKWLYVADGYYEPNGLHAANFLAIESMKEIIRDWYDLARADPDAVAFGVFIWGTNLPDYIGSTDFPCSVLLEHVAIGREITGKTRPTSGLPRGGIRWWIDTAGSVHGRACDPDGTLCEWPRIDLRKDGTLFGQASYLPWQQFAAANAECTATGYDLQFTATLPQTVSGFTITAVAQDLDSGSTTLLSQCAQSPGCLWFSRLYKPKGYMQAISVTGVASGWVCDPDAPHVSSKVRIVADTTDVGTFTTNLASEQAVADECRGGYLHRFSVQLPAWTKGRTMKAWAQDLDMGSPIPQVQIPWLCPAGTSCKW
ncbi:MAG TPA: hypothetical protein VKB93_09580 [Thermoanaerobaculia bacterium]|nr:hypothetical protein [Thermoanaerobaculia bacterium]